MTEKLLLVNDLKKYFKTDEGIVKAVDGISFHVDVGETFGLVGESGSGKSTTAFAVMGVYPPTGGEIVFKGQQISLTKVTKRPKSLKREMQMVFQDPGTSLNPKLTIKQILESPLKIHTDIKKEDVNKGVIKLLERVGLPEEYMERNPGGDRWWRKTAGRYCQGSSHKSLIHRLR